MKSTSDVAVVSPPAAHAPSIGTEGRRHDRTIAFDRPDVRIARERLPADATSDWHDHGDREAYGAVLDGRLRIEYVNGGDGDGDGDGRGAVTVDADQFVRLPAGLRHRERAVGGPVELVVAYVADRSTGADVPGVAADSEGTPQVAGESDLVPAGQLAGLTRLTPFPDAAVQLIRGHADGRIESTWHHHGDNEVFGHVLAGAGYVEWGTGEGERSLARAGDSFHVPVGLVHRDVNPDDAPQDYLVWLVGSDPRTVPVDGPGPVGSD